MWLSFWDDQAHRDLAAQNCCFSEKDCVSCRHFVVCASCITVVPDRSIQGELTKYETQDEAAQKWHQGLADLLKQVREAADEDMKKENKQDARAGENAVRRLPQSKHLRRPEPGDDSDSRESVIKRRRRRARSVSSGHRARDSCLQLLSCHSGLLAQPLFSQTWVWLTGPKQAEEE